MGKGGIDEMERTTADGIKQSRPDFSWRLNAAPLLSPFLAERSELEIFFRFWTRGKREWITYGEEAGAYVRVIKSGRVEREFLGERKFELLLRGGRVSSRA